MILENLELRNFRGYEHLSLKFDKGLFVIEGTNGSGKTNLVEAIYCLSLAKSWRCQSFSTLIKEGNDVAYISAYLLEENTALRRHLEIFFKKEERRILINNKPVKKLTDLSKIVNILLFTPKDVSLYKGAPSLRREFLDVSISKENEAYLASISKYGKLLLERNALLKDNKIDDVYLSTLDESLAKEVALIAPYRKKFLFELEKVLNEIAPELYGYNMNFKIIYKPFVVGENIQSEAIKLFQKNREIDKAKKVTTNGIQREDFSLLLNDKDIGLYGSQGENRLAAIALKIAPYFLKRANKEMPIAVLDDVYSELDDKRSGNLSKILKTMGQTFVTTTDIVIPGASYIEVHNHNATRRN